MANLSISRIKLFKSCRRAYQLKYIEGLTPVKTAEALETGLGYHEKLEELYRNGRVDIVNHSKEEAMAVAYAKYIYPQFKVKTVEEWVQYQLPMDTLIGRVDGIAEDGRLVEHKTTSGDVGAEYEYNLRWDEQVLAYMLCTGAREMYYTVCRKPTIRQKKDETDEEFFRRMVAWYDEDTDSKIRVLLVTRTDEEVEEFRRELEEMAREMRTRHYYRNPSYCRAWGRQCEYASVCLHYDPEQEYVEFIKEVDTSGNP